MKKYHLLYIAILGIFFTMVLNADLLYMVQSRSLFMSGSIFFADCMRVPGGFLTWIGLWLTQFLYYPALGGSMLVLLWLAIYYVLQRAIRPDESWSWLLLVPVIGLIVADVDLGYWIYLLKQHGYWFRETVGVLFVALMLWLQGHDGRQWRGALAGVLSLLAYPLFGWYAVLATACIVLRGICSAVKYKTGWILPVVFVVIGAFLPPMVAGQYSAFRKEEAFYAGFPVIESNLDYSWILTMPFVVVAVSMALICFVPLLKPMKIGRYPWLLHVVVMAMLTAVVVERNVGDANYHAEMRMCRQVEEFRWDDVLKEMKDAADRGGSTRQMALCKDLALINTQNIDKMFEYSNGDVNRVMRDSCGAYMLYTCGPLLALHHGMANTAIRWNIESSVEYGLSVSSLKVLTLAALINGEGKVADKYLSMLNLNLFQSSWVRRYRPLAANPSIMGEYPELAVINQLHSYPINETYGDHGHVEAEVYKPFNNLINVHMPDVQTLGVYYALKEKHRRRFWVQLQYYIQLHPGQPVPKLFQEAALLFHHLDPDNTGNMRMNFSEDLKKQFEFFNTYVNSRNRPGMSQAELSQAIKPKYGKSYWWYYYFNNTKPY